MEEPSDEILSQLMKEAAEEARHKSEEATTRFFNQLSKAAESVSLAW